MVPEKISQYLKDNFEQSFTSQIKRLKDKQGHPIYLAEVSYNDVLHHLKFNEHGNLISQQSEPYHEYHDDAFEWIDND